MPAFILATVGPLLAVAGAIFRGSCGNATTYFLVLILSHLPDVHSRRFVSGHDIHVAQIARFLRSLGHCLDLLQTYYVSTDRLGLCPAPHFLRFTTKDQDYKLHYIERIANLPG